MTALSTRRLRALALPALALLTTVAVPALAQACACGCGVFDIGVSTLMPSDTNTGFSAWFRYSYMNQDQNWEGTSKAPASDNDDKKLTTGFYTVGGQYMINRSWTVMAELPTFDRSLRTTDDDGSVTGHVGEIFKGHIDAIGDLQLMATYTGFSPDLSTGLTFGTKLATGDYTGPRGVAGGLEFDRDSLPGTGSTDLIIGGYHVDRLTRDNRLSYFVQARYQAAVFTHDHYRPGNELDAAIGLTYDFGQVGPLTKVAPVLQLIDSYREHDTGYNADYLNSGYERVLVAPGVDLRLTKKLHMFADVAIPVYQQVNAAKSVAIEGTSGQLTAPQLFKVQLAYDF